MLGPDSPLIGRSDLPSPVPPHALDALITLARARKYRQVLARRTGRLAVVVEDCYDPHNATAIIRTCDAFGVQRVVVTTGRNSFKVNRKVSQGSHYYVDLQLHPGIPEAYAALRAEGFAIYASDLAAGAVVGPQQLAPRLAQQPLALVFGNEGSGVSAEATRLADGCFLIPMVGFPQSLNLSVAVATTLYALRHTALESDQPGDLTAERQAALYELWVRRHTGQAGVELLRRAALEVDKQGDETEVFTG